MSLRPSSGLDFSDRRDAVSALDAHPDVVLQRGPSASLQRNKTERRRLQGVMRTTAAVEGQTLPSQMKDTGIMERYHTWLINGGRAKVIFGFYIFLHVLVIVYGFLHYQLKDTFTGTRSIVSLGFGTCCPLLCCVPSANPALVQQLPGPPHSSSISMSSSFFSQSAGISSRSSARPL
jgi:hypothetical protein